ncbi:MAG: undecaprenyldiphospho-muramoylpentapeptide beta-N-acetylglucosaminyltransferase [Acidimicrobiia bacterium]
MSSQASHAFAVLSGGGTAGHVSPALAVAQALVDRGHDKSDVWFAGSDDGMERELVPAAGYSLVTFPVWNFPRRVTPRHVVAVVRMGLGVVEAMRFVRRSKARCVVSFGGFASVPPVLAARVWRVPVVVVSYDAIPGSASKLASRWAKACAVAFADSPLPNKVFTGAPVRDDIAAVERRRDRSRARLALGIGDERFCVLVVGGSLGAGRLNDAVRAVVASHRDRTDLAIRHVVGARFESAAVAAQPSLTGENGLLYQVVGYEDRMDLAYAAADMIVCRAGANTVHEVATVGIPAVFVPWSGAAHDEQTANAKALSSRSAARLIADGDFDGDRLATEIERALSDRHGLEMMGDAARQFALPDAADRIAALIDKVAR